jgi:hypothetical protein
MAPWNNAVDGPIEEAFANACLSREEIASSTSTSSTYEVRELLVQILRAWTRLDKGGVIVASQSGSVFQAIEFYGPHKPVAVEIQYCVGKNRRDAEAFLRGEDILLITCSDITAAALRAHLHQSLSSSGAVDVGSGLRLQEGLMKPIAPVGSGVRGLKGPKLTAPSEAKWQLSHIAALVVALVAVYLALRK